LKIRIVIPTQRDQSTLDNLEHNYSRGGSKNTEISFSFISNSLDLNRPYHEIIPLLPEVIYKIKEAEREGVNAVVVAHYLDLGVAGGRELVSIPVLGSGHTTYRLASVLSRRISIITSVQSHKGPVENILSAENVLSKVVSIKAIELNQQGEKYIPDRCPEPLLKLSRSVVESDGSNLIILALNGYENFSNQVNEHLAKNKNPIQVLDPLNVTIKHAENLVNMKLSHSKITYPKPEIREILGYDHLQFK